MSPRLILPIGDRDHCAGRSDAPVTLVEYGDFECPFCGAAYPIVERIRRELGSDLRFVFRNFPLSEAHPHAEKAAEGAEAAAAQGKYWEMHHALFEHQQHLDDDALEGYATSIGLDVPRFSSELGAGAYEPRVHEDFMSGVRSGVNGTPTFFVNDERYDGAWGDAGAFLDDLSKAMARTHGGAPSRASR